jgi:pilus assembly protein CpaF
VFIVLMMINEHADLLRSYGHDNIYFRRNHSEVLQELDDSFRDEDHLMEIIDGIMRRLRRELSIEAPIIDVRLPDGSRVNTVIPPIAVNGPALTIRHNLVGEHLKVDDLLRFGSWDEQIVEFLRACMKARINIVVSGGTSSGKTTVLNVMAGMIPSTERIVVVQNEAELHIPQKHVIKLERRPADSNGNGEVTIQELIVNSLRMRPDRIILGECRSGEALEYCRL